jgi:uncharacterized protein with PQ loop repeat
MISDLVNVVFVASVVVPYVPQYLSIRRTRNPDGFSPAVSGILLGANIVRLFFWLARRFDAPLLAQSIVVIAAQGALLELCVRTAAERAAEARRLTGAAAPARSFGDLRWRDFWAWDDFGSYVAALTTLVAVLTVLSSVALGTAWFDEGLGVAALGLEACMALPQALRNARKHSTAGLSTLLVASWALGDAFKALYFASKGVPWQFLACAGFQLATDAWVLAQVHIWYPAH